MCSRCSRRRGSPTIRGNQLEGLELGIDVAGSIVEMIEEEVLFPEIDIRQRLTLQSGIGLPDGAYKANRSTVTVNPPPLIIQDKAAERGVREAARKDGTLRFTALLHHVNEGCLTEAFFHLKKTAAVGVDGVTVESPDTARIVTLSGDLTEFVYELGYGESIVATDVTTVAPEEAVLLPKAGIGRFLTAEGVLKHDPTLVIGDAQTAPASAIEQIRSAGVPVAITDVPTTFEGLYDKVDALGALLGSSDLAADLNDRIRTEVEAASADLDQGAENRRIAYVYTRGPDVMLLFGAGMTSTPVITAAEP